MALSWHSYTIICIQLITSVLSVWEVDSLRLQQQLYSYHQCSTRTLYPRQMNMIIAATSSYSTIEPISHEQRQGKGIFSPIWRTCRHHFINPLVVLNLYDFLSAVFSRTSRLLFSTQWKWMGTCALNQKVVTKYFNRAKLVTCKWHVTDWFDSGSEKTECMCAIAVLPANVSLKISFALPYWLVVLR